GVGSARADVVYLSATRTTHGTTWSTGEGPSTANDFTSTGFAAFDHTSGGNGSYAAGTATLHSTLNPTSITSSGDCYASGNHANGISFYGEARSTQLVTIQISQPTNLWYQRSTYTLAGPAGGSVVVRYRPTGGTYQDIPAEPVALPPGTYDISAEASTYGGNFALWG